MNTKTFFSKVFLWMFLGLLVSFAVGAFVSTQENILYNLYKNNIVWFLFIIELLIAVILSAGISKMSSMVAKILFFVYSFTTGLTLSSIFVVYELSSIVLVFAETALIFGVFSFIGTYTKIDLTKIGTFCYMALFGIILATLVNLFLGNHMFDIVLNVIGILVIVGILAYDTQKIKQLEYTMVDEEKAAIIGAFQLYLDFINIFLRLLSLFAKSKD